VVPQQTGTQSALREPANIKHIKQYSIEAYGSIEQYLHIGQVSFIQEWCPILIQFVKKYYRT
jgi:hypothetical protein